MSGKQSRRVLLSPDITEIKLMSSLDPYPHYQRNGGRTPQSFGNRLSRNASHYSPAAHRPCRNANRYSPAAHRPCRNTSRFTPGRYFRCIKASVARAVRFFSRRRGASSSKVSAATISHGRLTSAHDSHYSEAIDDCIEFINTSYRKSY